MVLVLVRRWAAPHAEIWLPLTLPLAGLWELDLPLVVVIQLTTLSTPEALWLVIESLCSGLGCSS